MQGGNNNYQLLWSMSNVLDSVKIKLSSECCIYRVPKRLRKVHENAYTPQVVSIGPLHHGKESLKPMEELKIRYLQVFLDRTKVTLDALITVVRGKETELRSCYAETIDLTSDQFVRIILVDAVFVIEVLLRFYEPGCREDNDRIFSKPYMLQDVWPDMRMLENQLPFFILDHLFEPYKGTLSGGKSMLYLSHHFFKTLMHIEAYANETVGTIEQLQPKDVAHFVDLVRKLYPIPPEEVTEPRPKSTTKPQEAVVAIATQPPAAEVVVDLTTEPPEAAGDVATETPIETPTESPEAEVDKFQGGILATPSMTKLSQAGVKFQKGSTTNMFDVEFKDGVLKMPQLIISDRTEVTVTNLQAFEHSQCEDGDKYINDYFFFVNCLVKTPQDVALLVKHNMLDNKLGDYKKGSTLLKNLVNGDVDSKGHFYFVKQCAGLKKYYENYIVRRRRWKEYLFKHFLYSPWATKEIIAAVIFLFLTLLQTVFSMLSYFRDRNINCKCQ